MLNLIVILGYLYVRFEEIGRDCLLNCWFSVVRCKKYGGRSGREN